MSEVRDEADKKPNPKNLMNSDHKATNEKYRDNYDRVFKHFKRSMQKADEIYREDLEKRLCDLYK